MIGIEINKQQFCLLKMHNIIVDQICWIISYQCYNIFSNFNCAFHSKKPTKSIKKPLFKTVIPLYNKCFSDWLLNLTEIHWHKLWKEIWLAYVRKCLCPFKWEEESNYSSVVFMIWNGLSERWPKYFVCMYLTVKRMNRR